MRVAPTRIARTVKNSSSRPTLVQPLIVIAAQQICNVSVEFSDGHNDYRVIITTKSVIIMTKRVLITMIVMTTTLDKDPPSFKVGRKELFSFKT